MHSHVEETHKSCVTSSHPSEIITFNSLPHSQRQPTWRQTRLWEALCHGGSREVWTSDWTFSSAERTESQNNRWIWRRSTTTSYQAHTEHHRNLDEGSFTRYYKRQKVHLSSPRVDTASCICQSARSWLFSTISTNWAGSGAGCRQWQSSGCCRVPCSSWSGAPPLWWCSSRGGTWQRWARERTSTTSYQPCNIAWLWLL